MNTHKDTSDLPNRDRRFASLRLKKRTRSWLRYLPASLMQFLWAGDKNGELAIANLALVDALDHPPAYGHLETLLKVFPELWKLDPKPFERKRSMNRALCAEAVL